MSYRFHNINDNSEFLHINPEPVVKDYRLYTAIKNLKTYIEHGSIDDDAYTQLKDELEKAMLNECDVMDNQSLIMETYINLGYLTSRDIDNAVYANLFRIFNYLVKTRDILKCASRIKVCKSLSDEPEMKINDLSVEKVNLVHYEDTEYDFEYSLSTLEILNLQAKTLVDMEKLPSYIVALDENIPLENVLKHNLFNYNTFTNSELYFHTMLPDPVGLHDRVESTQSLMEASNFFWIENENRYETFRNYIDFSYLHRVTSYCINNFKQHLDGLESVNITVMRDERAYYPSGQKEIYEVLSVIRKILSMMSITFNLSKMFQEHYIAQKELSLYEKAIEETKLITSQGNLTDTELKDELELSKKSLEELAETTKNANELMKRMQEASGSYNSFVMDGKESGLDLTRVNSLLINSAQKIQKMIDKLKSLISSLKGASLSSYQFILNLHLNIDLSFLNSLSQLIMSINKLFHDLMCLLNAIACFASYVKDMYDTLKSFYEDDEDKFDPSKYMLGGLSLGINSKAVNITADTFRKSFDEILEELKDDFEDSELNNLRHSLNYAMDSFNSECIKAWLDEKCSEALQAIKETLEAGQKCKLTPGGKLSIDAGLKFSWDINIPDLRFQFRNCTGAN